MYFEFNEIMHRLAQYAPMSGQCYYLRRLKPGDFSQQSIGRDGRLFQFAYQTDNWSEVGITHPIQGRFIIFQIYTGSEELFYKVRKAIIEATMMMNLPCNAEEWNDEKRSGTIAGPTQ